MAELVLQDIDPAVLRRLADRARRNGRTVEEEARSIIEEAAPLTPVEFRQIADRFRARFGSRLFSDSADLIREDRER